MAQNYPVPYLFEPIVNGDKVLREASIQGLSFISVADGTARSNLTAQDVKGGAIVFQADRNEIWKASVSGNSVSFTALLLARTVVVSSTAQPVLEGNLAQNGDNLYFAKQTVQNVTTSTDFTTSAWIRLSSPVPATWAQAGNTDIIPTNKLPAQQSGTPADGSITLAKLSASLQTMISNIANNSRILSGLQSLSAWAGVIVRFFLHQLQ